MKNELVTVEENIELTEHEVRKDILDVKTTLENTISRYDSKINLLEKQAEIFDKMNRKLLHDMDNTDPSHFKRKSQLQRIYMSNMEIGNLTTSTLLEYEKLRNNMLKELRTINNDKVKNIKSLEASNDSDGGIIEVFKQINKLFNTQREITNAETRTEQEQLFIDVQAELANDGYAVP